MCGTAVAQPADRPFIGHQVHRVTVTSQQQLLAVTSLADEVWSCHIGVGPIDAQFSPDKLPALTQLGVEHQVLIADVQALLDAERAQVQAAHLQRDLNWFNTYRTLAEIHAQLDALAAANPLLATTFIAGQTLEGRDIKGIRFSAPDMPGNPRSARPAVLFNGAQHAREWISPMTNMYIADFMLSGYGTDARIQEILQNVEVFVVPVVNADGYVYTWTTQRLWRKNRRPNAGGTFGVDLNRNWGYQWGGIGSSSDPNSDIYRGTGPFSEPETQALSNYFLANPRIRANIDFHSYGQLVLTPWGYTPSLPPDSVLFDEINSTLVSAIQSVNGRVYTAGPSYTTIYPTTGSIKDWVYGGAGRLSWTIELRDTGQFGFVLPADQIIPTAQENFPAALALCEVVSTPLWYTFPDGAPEFIPPEQTSTVRVNIKNGGGELAGTAPMLYARTTGAPGFTPSALSLSGGNAFIATFPAAYCRQYVEYYFEATTTGGETVRFPADAPTSVFTTRALRTYPMFSDSMETNTGWTVGSATDTATSGLWELADPQETTAQPGEDVSAAGTMCWVTGALAGSGVNSFDVDGGATTLTSPRFSAINPTRVNSLHNRLSYWRWYSNERGSAPFIDTLSILISNNDGASWTPLETTGENKRNWVPKTWSIPAFIAPTAQMRIRFVASDTGSASAVEAAIDEAGARLYGCPRTADFDGDGDVGTDMDIEAFFAALGGSTCATCDSADYDGDGDVGTDLDIEEFFRILGGG